MVPAIDYKKIEVQPNVRKRLEPVLSSWRTVHPRISNMKDSQKNLDMLGAILSLELNSGQPRKQVLTRLHMKINAMRRELEFNRVMAAAKG